jgi:hypothetical protein
MDRSTVEVQQTIVRDLEADLRVHEAAYEESVKRNERGERTQEFRRTVAITKQKLDEARADLEIFERELPALKLEEEKAQARLEEIQKRRLELRVHRDGRNVDGLGTLEQIIDMIEHLVAAGHEDAALAAEARYQQLKAGQSLPEPMATAFPMIAPASLLDAARRLKACASTNPPAEVWKWTHEATQLEQEKNHAERRERIRTQTREMAAR